MSIGPGPDDDPAAGRAAWFEFYTSMRNVYASGGGPYTCPCCGHLTLAHRAMHETCPECRWDDDGQDDHDSDVVRGGPNGPESLDDARARYRAGGGIPGEHRPPPLRPDETE